jgi:AraC family transcriptional activator of pobA
MPTSKNRLAPAAARSGRFTAPRRRGDAMNRRCEDRPGAVRDPGHEAVRTIAFDVGKYGRYLLADAGRTDALPGFITSPQRHRLAFYEIALVEAGHGHLDIDGAPLQVRPYRVIVTAPGESRSWRLDDAGLRASVAFFDARWLDDVAGDLAHDATFPVLGAPRVARSLALPQRDFSRMVRVVDDMRDELADARADSVHVLRAQFLQLLLLLQRHGAGSMPQVRDAAFDVARRFRRLVDQRFAVWPDVADYAKEMRISPRHLNACVKRSTGRTASGVIHDRLVVESQRRLLSTREPVAAIAEALGFCDASYFVRFFRRQTGCTPAEFRRHRGSPIVDRITD